MLLCGFLGDPDSRPLTVAQFRALSRRAEAEFGVEDPAGAVTEGLLCRWGYAPEEAARIAGLLNREALLDRYLRRAETLGVTLLARISPEYPQAISRALRWEAPPVLALWGNESLLRTRCMSLVGSREPTAEAASFAWEAGRQMASQGVTLVSGNARGCDKLAAKACQEAGGRVIAVVSDELAAHCRGQKRESCLYISEMGYDLPFTAARALSRNRVIHVLGEKVFAVEPRNRKGGTWAGTAENLRKGWTPVFVADSQAPGTLALRELGATPVRQEALSALEGLEPAQMKLF